MLLRERDLIGAEPALRPAEQAQVQPGRGPGERHDRARQRVRSLGQEQQPSAGRGGTVALGTGAIQCARGLQLGDAIAAALLAGTHRYRLPVPLAALRPRIIEPHDAVPARERHDRRDAELGGFLHDEIHALGAYQALQQHTYSEVERINNKFAEGDWRPIVLIDEHQEPTRVFELYRAADFCLVNSLHDGMNLVAKEFVAARDDEDGVLILSTFAGASRELPEAVLINPFDVTETAEAMEIAMRMGRDERRNRMSLMRRTVKENNVYRWAGRMLMDAARIRQRQSLPSPRRHGASSGG